MWFDENACKLISKKYEISCKSELEYTVIGLNNVIMLLSFREQSILYMKFVELRTLENIAKILDCSKPQINNIIYSSIQKISAKGLHNFLLSEESFKDINDGIDKLGLSMRCNASLIEYGIVCISQLLDHTYEDIEVLNGFGETNMKYLNSKLQYLGYDELKSRLALRGISVRDEYKTLNITEMNLFKATADKLNSLGVKTVDDVLHLTERDFYGKNGLGRKIRKEIVSKLRTLVADELLYLDL